MLTKQDLNAIGDLIDVKLEPIQSDIKNLQKDMTVVKKDVKKIKKVLETDFGYHEKHHISEAFRHACNDN